MAPPTPDPIDACFVALERAIERDPVLSRDLAASRHEFLGGRNGASEDPAESALGRRRLLEWFLLEKVHAGAGEARVSALIEQCAGGGGESVPELDRALAASHASLFEVGDVEAEGRLKLWDLAGLFELTAIEPEGSRVLARGDLIAGRVFPTDGSTCRISRAAVVWRNPRLLEAIRADLERARAEGATGSKGIVRLRQADLEAMFHIRGLGIPANEPVEAPSAVELARRLLDDAGVDREESDAIFRFLAEERPGEGDLVPGLLPGAHDALAVVLDELAFGTSVDLDAARVSLTAAWDEIHAARAAPRVPELEESPADVASAVAAFDRRRSEGASLEETFRDLERDLGLADEALDDEEDTPAPDFPGVVGAMIEEFLWEEQREHGSEGAERFEILRSLGRFAGGIGLFENLTARELTAYACHWVLDEREITSAETATRLVDALGRFCAWAQATQEVPLRDTFATTVAALRESLPRLAEANRHGVRVEQAADLEWLDVVSVEGPRSIRVRAQGAEERTVEAEPGIVAGLRSGDVIRARRAQGAALEIHGCFPGEIRELQRS